MPTFVGIDLGTTNSAVAYRNAYGRPEVIANREGQNITPSVVYFGADPPVVGQEAKEWARLGNEEIASFFKPHMGNPLFQLQFHGKTYSATDLSTLVLRRLKEDAEARLGDQVDRAVITVPAYFADPQRKATIEAGQAAGFQVLRIINEPTAAALAYGLQKTGVEETVLIYDLGGGTFDVTVARITPEEIVILSTAGDHDLGGKNWDDRIATFLAERFAAETGFDPLDDPVALNEVLVRSEQAKWALSERTSTRITLQLGTERRSFELTRAEFEAMTFPLMDRTRRLTEEALGEADLAWPRLDGVLLVGGSTRMPMVRTYVSQMAGKPPRAGVNVDEVVALGAAIQAAIEVGQSIGDAVPRFTLSAGGPQAAATDAGAPSRRVTDVMSHSLGTIAVSPDGSAYVNDIVIRRNLPIPASNTKSYLHETHGGSNTRLEVYLTQGESSTPLDCTILGKYVFDGIHATDAEVTVDVGLSYDSNGVVQVQAVQRDTGHRLPMTVEPVPDDLSWLGRPPETSAAARRARADPGLSADRRLGEHDRPAADRGPDGRARVPVEVRLHDHGSGLDLVFDPGRAAIAGDEQRAPAARGGPPARGRGEHQPDRRPGDGARATGRRRPQAVHRDLDRRLSRRPRECRRAGGRPRAAGDRDRGDRHRRRRPRLPAPAGQQRAGLDLRPER